MARAEFKVDSLDNLGGTFLFYYLGEDLIGMMTREVNYSSFFEGDGFGQI